MLRRNSRHCKADGVRRQQDAGLYVCAAVGADGIVVLADGAAEQIDGAAEQVDCAVVRADLTIVIEDFNKRRKCRGTRVWRGKKYV